ncbi:MAG: TonB family protein [Pseudomonadota bacterium]|jgi:TonB family protein|nr:energy transducer TonB [Alphaproteobacteria bacterium]
MVKMRFIFLGSILLHGLLAISISQYITGSKYSEPNSFSIKWIDSQNKPADQQKFAITENSSLLQRSDHKKIKEVASSSVTDSNVDVAKIIYNPAPAYPAQAKSEGIEGFFLVKMLVNENGVVELIEISTLKGQKEIFEEAIIVALKTWKFTSADKKTSFEVPISFQLDS